MIQLTAKELARADGDLTTYVRPNRQKGGWNVAVVRVSTGEPIFKVRHVESRDQIQKEIQSDLRMVDKCGGLFGDSKMADRSRHRASEKHMALEFDTTAFEFSHGKRPSGEGHWAFTLRNPDRHDWTVDEAIWVPGMLKYSDAKKEFARVARMFGVRGVVYACT